MKKTFTIAEIGQAHDGSLGILYSYINALSNTGIDAVKFQMHIAEAESSNYEKFRVKFSYQDKTRYDYWKRMEFSYDQWNSIKKHCDNLGIEFICSPFSCLAVDWLERIGVKKYKIGSGEVQNLLMLEKIAKTGKEIILSSGMSSFKELDKAVSLIRKYNKKITILQCTTKYPTGPRDIGLNVIQEIKKRYRVKAGLSDHSGKIFPLLSATTLGADVIEFHVVFDRQMFGPDSSSSLTINEVNNLIEGVSFINKCNSSKINKKQFKSSKKLKNIFEKSLAINKNLKKGSIIRFEDLETKKPYNIGIPASNYKKVIGNKINRDLTKWHSLKKNDLIIYKKKG